ncbi:NAD(P)-binding protein [Halobacillus salinarum]|uniref:precorrin-2 dehydrogenase n=1 Tax=Halobacillus salinarum TaxID=2932257 RepID=A0ABY4EIP2_9BACI|nr:NAD(P)-binding protein [Halobacillus salinarum]UOQ44363.1 NAD(P)-binding protein [Halobacillus salinarum]
MGILPLMVDLSNQRVVVVGGGQVAERRVLNLAEWGVTPEVISPALTSGLDALWKEQSITWKQKTFDPSDLQGAFFIVAATNQPAVNQQIIDSAPKDSLINDAEKAERGNVYIPASIKRGRLSISISTNGASPLLAGQLKKQMEQDFDEEYGNYIEFLYEARKLIKHSMLSKEKQQSLLKELLAEQFLLEEKQMKMIDWLYMLLKKEDEQCLD